ncbi:MAG: hypothetical protein ACYCOR_20615, partial [Acidobacteriaceae bacterium]
QVFASRCSWGCVLVSLRLSIPLPHRRADFPLPQDMHVFTWGHSQRRVPDLPARRTGHLATIAQVTG